MEISDTRDISETKTKGLSLGSFSRQGFSESPYTYFTPQT